MRSFLLVVTATLALLASSAAALAAQAPTLHGTQLSGEVTSLATTCHANVLERTEARYAAAGAAAGRMAGTFEGAGVVHHLRLTAWTVNPVVLEATAHDAAFRIVSGTTTADVVLRLARWGGTEVHCGGGLGGEGATTITRTTYAATITGPGGTTTEQGVADVRWTAVHDFNPNNGVTGELELRFRRRGGL